MATLIPTRGRYGRRLDEMKNRVLKMSVAVEEAIAGAITALVDRNDVLATTVRDGDKAINRMEAESLELCANIIAREQPVANDLRHIIAAMKIFTDLERMGDYAANIAKLRLKTGDAMYFRSMDEVKKLGEIGIRQLRNAVASYIHDDCDLARKTSEEDKELDEAHYKLIKELTRTVPEDADTADNLFSLVFIVRYLERVGDHAVNICEWTIYASSGELAELYV